MKALRKYGGELQLGTKVTKILVENNTATGVETTKGNKISAKYVVSNADARQTFLSLIGSEKLSRQVPESFGTNGTIYLLLSSMVRR